MPHTIAKSSQRKPAPRARTLSAFYMPKLPHPGHHVGFSRAGRSPVTVRHSRPPPCTLARRPSRARTAARRSGGACRRRRAGTARARAPRSCPVKLPSTISVRLAAPRNAATSSAGKGHTVTTCMRRPSRPRRSSHAHRLAHGPLVVPKKSDRHVGLVGGRRTCAGGGTSVRGEFDLAHALLVLRDAHVGAARPPSRSRTRRARRSCTSWLAPVTPGSTRGETPSSVSLYRR